LEQTNREGKKVQVSFFHSPDGPLTGLVSVQFMGPVLVELKLAGDKPGGNNKTRRKR
jgi:hypothetical protein